jgi:predicted DNA-binding transcriptional regulator AlpA
MVEIRLRVPDLLSYSDAARLIGKARTTIYNLIEQGKLHPFNIGENHYILREEIERVAKERATAEAEKCDTKIKRPSGSRHLTVREAKQRG